MFSTGTQIVILVIDTVLDGFDLAFCFTGIIIVSAKFVAGNAFRKTTVGRAVNLVWYLSKWPALAFIIFDPFAHWACGMKMDGLYWLIEALTIYNWWWYRNVGDDDDFWKKKLKKAMEKIAQIGSKLVAVPEPA
jgi:hypothetical protein